MEKVKTSKNMKNFTVPETDSNKILRVQKRITRLLKVRIQLRLQKITDLDPNLSKPVNQLMIFVTNLAPKISVNTFTYAYYCISIYHRKILFTYFFTFVQAQNLPNPKLLQGGGQVPFP